MIFADLTKGQRFTLEGGDYEVQTLGERIVLAFILDKDGNRMPDPDDVVGDKYLTTAFSDLRFEREHRTPEDDARFEDLI